MERFQVNTKHATSHNNQRVILIVQILLRILGFAFCLCAVWRIVTSRQVILFGFDARYTYSSSMKFFAYANIIGCALSVVSLFLLLLLIFCCKRHLDSSKYFYLFLHDFIVFGLLVSGCAAATAVGYLGKYGQKQSGWNPVCAFVPKFCHKVTVSVTLSYIATIIYLCLTIISAYQSRQVIRV